MAKTEAIFRHSICKYLMHLFQRDKGFWLRIDLKFIFLVLFFCLIEFYVLFKKRIAAAVYGHAEIPLNALRLEKYILYVDTHIELQILETDNSL